MTKIIVIFVLKFWWFFMNVISPAISPYVLFFTSAYLLFFFFKEEKKGPFFISILDLPRISFLSVFVPFLLLLLFLFVYNRFLFFPLMALGLSLPYVYGQPKKEEENEVYFTYFIFTFLYKGTTFLIILIISFCQILGISFEFLYPLLFSSFDGGETNKMMFGMKGILKSELEAADAAKGLKKVEAVNNLRHTFNQYKLLFLRPEFACFDSLTEYFLKKDFEIEEKVLWMSALDIKTAHHYSYLTKQPVCFSLAKQLESLAGWNEAKNKVLDEIITYEALQEAVGITEDVLSPLKEHPIQNELVCGNFIKAVGSLKQNEICLLKAEHFKRIADYSFSTNFSFPAVDYLQIIEIDDKVNIALIKPKGGLVVLDKDGITQSKGPEARLFLIAKEKGDFLVRPFKETLDFQGKLLGLRGFFEEKFVPGFYFSLDKNELTSWFRFLERPEEIADSNFILKGHVRRALQKEAFIVLDVSQIVWSIKNNVNNNSYEALEIIHKSLTKDLPENIKGKPIIYLSQVSPSETILIKKEI